MGALNSTYGYKSKTDIRAENQSQNAALISVVHCTTYIIERRVAKSAFPLFSMLKTEGRLYVRVRVWNSVPRCLFTEDMRWRLVMLPSHV